MTFRRASYGDISRIADLLEPFYAKSGKPYCIPFDRPSAEATVRQVIHQGYCLVGQASCAGAIPVPFPFNRNVIIAYVIFWHAKRGRELTIFDALCRECAARGATLVNSSSLFPANTIGRLYERRGHWPVETQFLGLAKQPERDTNPS